MSNITVTLDVIHHSIFGRKNHILDIRHTFDKIISLMILGADSAKGAIKHYFTRWIYIVDASYYFGVNCGIKLII